jgi:hypothetical protein
MALIYLGTGSVFKLTRYRGLIEGRIAVKIASVSHARVEESSMARSDWRIFPWSSGGDDTPGRCKGETDPTW